MFVVVAVLNASECSSSCTMSVFYCFFAITVINCCAGPRSTQLKSLQTGICTPVKTNTVIKIKRTCPM